MKQDITTRQDIEKLLIQFYSKVKTDDTIGFFFTDVVKLDWDLHIPLIADFWETILLDNPVYHKNAMQVHYDIHRKSPLKKEHFDRWIQLFTETIDELFEGKTAQLAKSRAKSIASLMQFKMK
jgi:hemoglobin